MAVYSVNQVRQLYVAKECKGKEDTLATAGDIKVVKAVDDEHVYFQYMGAGNNLMRSDLIPIKNIIYAKAIDGKTMEHKMRRVKVTLADAVLEDGKPASGHDYLLRVVINPYIGMSDEEPYLKYGVVHTFKSTTKAKFYATMALSLVKNFSRELGPMLKFILAEGVTETEVKAGMKIEELTGNYDALILEEVDQEWRLGIKSETFVNFDVHASTIELPGEGEITWGEVEEAESKVTINNGRKIADLEYFAMGERGDVYRGVGFPNTIPTEYLVTPFAADGTPDTYHVFEIHYAFTDEGIGVQKSEKDIEIVCNSKEELNKVVDAFNTITGMSVSTL